MEAILSPSTNKRDSSFVLDAGKQSLAPNRPCRVHRVIVIPSTNDELLFRLERRIESAEHWSMDRLIDMLECVHVVGAAVMV